jgi:Ca2+-binding RTX toxin-like protein
VNIPRPSRRRVTLALCLSLVAGVAAATLSTGGRILDLDRWRPDEVLGATFGRGTQSQPASAAQPTNQGNQGQGGGQGNQGGGQGNQPGGPPFGPPSQPVPGQPGGPPFPPDDASCDADGVTVGYTASFENGGFRVTKAVVRDVSLTCQGASVTVILRGDDGEPLGQATTPAEENELLESASVTVSMGDPSEAPLAQSVTSVEVILDGGEVPVPPECMHMTFDKVIFGTLGDDVIGGTAQRDLIYGLSGNDQIDGGPQADCLVAGSGDNVLRGGPGSDVLIGGPGNDTIYGDQGNDTIYSGPGTNLVDGGQGTNTCYVSPQSTVARCQTVIEREDHQW